MLYIVYFFTADEKICLAAHENWRMALTVAYDRLMLSRHKDKLKLGEFVVADCVGYDLQPEEADILIALDLLENREVISH